jgi:hypothetical protein
MRLIYRGSNVGVIRLPFRRDKKESAFLSRDDIIVAYLCRIGSQESEIGDTPGNQGFMRGQPTNAQGRFLVVLQFFGIA